MEVLIYGRTEAMGRVRGFGCGHRPTPKNHERRLKLSGGTGSVSESVMRAESEAIMSGWG